MGQRFDRRGKRTDEMLELMKALWEPGWTEFEGEFYSAPRMEMEPTPPPIPIYVGGLSDIALRRAARHDGWIGDLITTDRAVERVDRLREMRAENGLTMRRFHHPDAADRRVHPRALRTSRGKRHHRHHHDAVDVLRRAAGHAGREDRRHAQVPQGPRVGHVASQPHWLMAPSSGTPAGRIRTALSSELSFFIKSTTSTSKPAASSAPPTVGRRTPLGSVLVAIVPPVVMTTVPQRRSRPKPRRGAVAVAAVAVRRLLSIDSDPAPVVASSRNAKQNMIASSPPLPPSSAIVRPEARRLAPAQRRPVLVEVREGHLAGSDESRYPREQSDDDQQAEDEFDEARPPERPCADRHGLVPSGQPNNFIEPCRMNSRPKMIRKDAQDGRGETRQTGIEVGRHGLTLRRNTQRFHSERPDSAKSPGLNR